MTRFYAFARRERSQATVEFALVGIILFVLVPGTIDRQLVDDEDHALGG